MKKIIIIFICTLSAAFIAETSFAAQASAASLPGWQLFMTHPITVTVLLSLASFGLVLQLFSPHFGFGGILSILALLIFYVVHFIAGFASWLGIIMLLIGVGLVLLEFLLPGGIVGIIGFAAIIVSLISSGANTTHMAYAVLIALIIAVVGMVIMMKFFGKKLNLLNKMVLKDSTDTEHGYVSNLNRTDLLGKVAVTATPLRPSGTAMLGDERIDVVTEGGYIEAHRNVIIIKVEGVRIVVRESENV
ncbi:NfeD family protein [Rummeliibacillus sp. TYF-LIM-RU47]|uniref:NfeD family protein n=1 Tax=Rummeliibacillus sp. TYF-LIM-RU47 TaxID=2608406 RepID=UPI00123BC2B7|nr:NfeD family protein [Rummeliibacillus sp. TYF-LIM-RU47]